MKKRIIAFAMCLLLVISVFPVNAAEAAKKEKKFRPEAPALSVEASPTGVAELSWNPVEGATGYRVYRMTGTETIHSAVVTTTKQTYNDKDKGGAERGTKISYRIRAFYKDEDGNRVWSSFSDPVVWKNPKKVLEISETEAVLQSGEYMKLKIRNATSEVTWKSTNSNVASIDGNGKVHALRRGTCTLVGTTQGYKFKCALTVEAPEPAKRVLDPTKPIIALSFDDGPSIYTPKILDLLADYGSTATFFMVGYNIDRYGSTVQAVYDAGCEVANHTINHPNLKKLSEEDIDKEISGNLKKINKLIGDGKRLVRPPGGNYNDTVKSIVGAPMIIWSDDTRDWESRNAQSVFKEVKGSARDGYIILMHDIYQSSYEGICLVLPWLIEQGYQVCSVSELFEARGVELEDGVTYSQCISAAKYKELNGLD